MNPSPDNDAVPTTELAGGPAPERPASRWFLPALLGLLAGFKLIESSFQFQSRR